MNEKVIIYKSSEFSSEVEVKFDGDTFWLSQIQISELFHRSRTVITKHINNIFKSGELDAKSNVQKMHIANSDKPITLYNLEVILSVGYRVNSKQGTHFRQWVTQRLKEYLVQGYAINQKRLEELGKIVQLIEKSGKSETLQLQEARGLLEVLSSYHKSFVLLNRYDSNTIDTQNLTENITYEIQYNEAKQAINELKKQLIAKSEASELFGNEKDDSFNGSLKSIVQTFNGHYLYPSIEEQAALHFL